MDARLVRIAEPRIVRRASRTSAGPGAVPELAHEPGQDCLVADGGKEHGRSAFSRAPRLVWMKTSRPLEGGRRETPASISSQAAPLRTATSAVRPGMPVTSTIWVRTGAVLSAAPMLAGKSRG